MKDTVERILFPFNMNTQWWTSQAFSSSSMLIGLWNMKRMGLPPGPTSRVQPSVSWSYRSTGRPLMVALARLPTKMLTRAWETDPSKLTRSGMWSSSQWQDGREGILIAASYADPTFVMPGRRKYFCSTIFLSAPTRAYKKLVRNTIVNQKKVAERKSDQSWRWFWAPKCQPPLLNRASASLGTVRASRTTTSRVEPSCSLALRLYRHQDQLDAATSMQARVHRPPLWTWLYWRVHWQKQTHWPQPEEAMTVVHFDWMWPAGCWSWRTRLSQCLQCREPFLHLSILQHERAIAPEPAIFMRVTAKLCQVNKYGPHILARLTHAWTPTLSFGKGWRVAFAIRDSTIWRRVLTSVIRQRMVMSFGSSLMVGLFCIFFARLAYRRVLNVSRRSWSREWPLNEVKEALLWKS